MRKVLVEEFRDLGPLLSLIRDSYSIAIHKCSKGPAKGVLVFEFNITLSPVGLPLGKGPVEKIIKVSSFHFSPRAEEFRSSLFTLLHRQTLSTFLSPPRQFLL